MDQVKKIILRGYEFTLIDRTEYRSKHYAPQANALGVPGHALHGCKPYDPEAKKTESNDKEIK